MDFATVHFICQHMVVTVQVAQPDIDDDDYIIGVAEDIVKYEYGFSPSEFAFSVEVDY